MPYKRGQSGNPAGKPKGAKDKRTELRALIQPHAEKLIKKVVTMALGGDLTALRICIDRIIPPLKSVDQPVSIAAFCGSVADRGKAVLDAVAAGKIAPDTASTLMQTIAFQAKIIESDELEKRIAALEGKS